MKRTPPSGGLIASAARSAPHAGVSISIKSARRATARRRPQLALNATGPGPLLCSFALDQVFQILAAQFEELGWAATGLS